MSCRSSGVESHAVMGRQIASSYVASIPYAILADAAESVGGKLYVLGGGWDRMVIPSLPGRGMKPFAFGLGITVPYTHTNRKFALAVEMIDGEGGQVGDRLQIELEAGRPPGLQAGVSQNIPIAINLNPEFPSAGPYTVVASIDGEIKNRAMFLVMLAQQMPGFPPAASSGA